MTKTYRYYNNNPQRHNASDCVVRSIARATKQPWLIVFLGLVKIAMCDGWMPNDSPVYEKYLQDNGWKKMKQPLYKGRVITGKTFLKRIRRKTDIIVSIGKQHLTVISNGKFRDTWDCSNDVVGNYWVKKNGKQHRHTE